MLIRWALIGFLVVLLLRAIARLLAGMLEGAGFTRGTSGTTGARGSTVHLVRDPVCGTHVVQSRAVTLGAGAERQYFCSERCRDRYLAGRRPA